MKKQAFNPYLPSYEYIPDGEPHVFGDRLYVFGSHDRFNGKKFCMNDYVSWSASINDLADWRYEGVIYKKTQDPDNPDGKQVMYAPDVAQGVDGRYYLYYGLADDNKIGVAVCDTPAGKYEFLDCVHDKDGKVWGKRPQDFMPFDPGILVDDDGKVHLYAGQAPMFLKKAKKEYDKHFRNTAFHVELMPDMVTMKTEPVEILPNILNSKGTGFEKHEMFEANSIRKFEGKYYFIYSSVQSHELCWAVSDRPDGGFKYGGVLTSNGDIKNSNSDDIKYSGLIKDGKNYIGNNHGSIVKINDNYYIFGHRHTNRHIYSRQGYAEKINFHDGIFDYAPLTSCGLNNGPLEGIGNYEARIACHLMSKDGITFSAHKIVQNKKHPSFTQDGEDREDNPNQYINNMRDGAKAGFRYFDFKNKMPNEISVKVRGKAEGLLNVFDDENNGKLLASIPIKVNDKNKWCDFSNEFKVEAAIKPIYFIYKGKGSIDFMSFELKKQGVNIL